MRAAALGAALLLTGSLSTTPSDAAPRDDPNAIVSFDVVTGAKQIRERPLSAPDPNSLRPGALPTAARATAAAPNPTIGRLYHSGDSECSASVLTGARHDLIITAGHCVSAGDGTGPYPGIKFVPGMVPGGPEDQPYGSFLAKNIVTMAGWQDHGWHQWDVAIVQLEPNADGQNVGDAVGSWNGIIVNEPLVADRTVWGYRLDDTQQVCSGTTDRWLIPPDNRLKIPCVFPHGASGGPWLEVYGDDSHLGYVNGVISQGSSGADGETISPYFDDDVLGMWQLANS